MNIKDSIYGEYDITEEVGSVNYKLNENNMKNGIGKLSMVNVKSAVVSGLLWGLLAVGMYAVQVGSVFKLDWHFMVDAFVFAFLGFAINAIKNLLTTNDGNFLGSVKVAE